MTSCWESLTTMGKSSPPRDWSSCGHTRQSVRDWTRRPPDPWQKWINGDQNHHNRPQLIFTQCITFPLFRGVESTALRYYVFNSTLTSTDCNSHTHMFRKERRGQILLAALHGRSLFLEDTLHTRMQKSALLLLPGDKQQQLARV